MKKFLTIAAAVATSAVLITSVFAETTNDLTATYDASTGIVTLGNAPTLATTTYIVFDRNNQDGFATEAVAEGQIKQINQEENAVTEIYVGPLADGKYQVRLGGDGNVRNGLFEVASATPTPTPTATPTTEPDPTPVQVAAKAVGGVFEGFNGVDTDRSVAAMVDTTITKATNKVTWKINVTRKDGMEYTGPTTKEVTFGNIDANANMKVGLIVSYADADFSNVEITGIEY